MTFDLGNQGADYGALDYICIYGEYAFDNLQEAYEYALKQYNEDKEGINRILFELSKM